MSCSLCSSCKSRLPVTSICGSMQVASHITSLTLISELVFALIHACLLREHRFIPPLSSSPSCCCLSRIGRERGPTAYKTDIQRPTGPRMNRLFKHCNHLSLARPLLPISLVQRPTRTAFDSFLRRSRRGPVATITPTRALLPGPHARQSSSRSLDPCASHPIPSCCCCD